MRFQWPDMLWLLALVPVMALAYLSLIRRRRRAARRLEHLISTSGAGGVVAGRWWRVARHLPAILFATAMIVAIFAIARPTAVVTLPTKQQTIMLAIDVSLSMRARDILPSRLVAAQAAAKSFVQELPADLRVGIVAFAGTASLVQPPTRNREELIAAIDRFELQRGTATGSAMMVALATLFPDHGIDVEVATLGARRGALRGGAQDRSAREPAKGAAKEFVPVAPGSYRSAAIVLLSDGRRTTGPDPVDVAKMAADRGVRVFTVGFGTVEGAEVDIGGWSMYLRLDEVALKAVAEATGAEYFHAGTEEGLRVVYQGLGSKLVLEKAETEISALFIAVSAVLALLSAGLSVAWFGRIA